MTALSDILPPAPAVKSVLGIVFTARPLDFVAIDALITAHPSLLKPILSSGFDDLLRAPPEAWDALIGAATDITVDEFSRLPSIARYRVAVTAILHSTLPSVPPPSKSGEEKPTGEPPNPVGSGD